MNSIVCVSRDWGIGNENKLLFHISDDLKRFKSLTTGKVVVMGHNTLLSLPGSKPLPNRTNIVLSRNENLSVEGVTVCHNVQELLIELSEYPSDDVFVIGGETIYRLLLPQCRRVYLTRVDAVVPADAYFPDLGELQNWSIESESPMLRSGEVSFSYVNYLNNAE